MKWLKTLVAIVLLLVSASAVVTLEYSTYVGGASNQDQPFGIAVDNSGNVYVAGFTGASDYPTTAGAYDETFNAGGNDAFVFKLSADGSTLVYSTFIGGTGTDQALGLAIDSSGNAYITGQTRSGDYPVTSGAFDESHNGGTGDNFVTKLNATGTGLVYSTYLGGSGFDLGENIAVDSSGNAYVVTQTPSTNFPTTGGVFNSTYGGGSNDAGITVLNSTGNGLIYSGFLGGSDNDVAKAIVVDSSGNAYVSGFSRSSDFQTTVGAFDTTYSAGEDVFVAKISADGSTLVYSTFIGGPNDERTLGITVDSSGNAYITGKTNSDSYPTVNAFDGSLNGSAGVEQDAFITKVNSAGSALVYSTYLGGTGSDFGRDIEVDSNGVVYVTGETVATDFPTTVDAFNATYSGSQDAFVLRLSSDGLTLGYSTFLGGSGGDKGVEIALDSPDVYIAGLTSSADFPTTAGAYNETYGGGSDVFVSKFAGIGTVPLDFSWSCDDASLFIVNSTGGSASSICTITNNEASPLSMSFTNTTLSLGSVSISPTATTVSASGTQQVNYTVTVAAGSITNTTFDAEATANSTTTNTVTITVERNDTQVVALSTNTATTCLGDTFRLTADSSISAFTCKDCSTDCSVSCDADFTSLNPASVTVRNGTEQNITCGVVDDGGDTFAGELCVTVDSADVASGKESLLELLVFCAAGWTSLDTTVTTVTGGFRVCGDIGTAETCTALASGFIIVGTDAPVFTTGPTVTETTNVTASINWSTDETANYTIVVSGIGVTNSTSGFATTYAVNITGLTPSTSYTFNVSACNTENCSLAQGFTFTTSASANASDPNSDVDGDGISDGDEITLYGTNPYVADTDSDGFTDFEEVELGSSPTDSSSVPSAAYSSIQVAPAFGIIGIIFLLLGAIILSFIAQPRP